MRISNPLRGIACAAAVACAVSLGQFSQAVVLHPGDPGVPAGSRPADGVVGLWDTDGSASPANGANASAVAIAANWALTVRHQTGGNAAPNATITFGGTEYKVAEEFTTGSVDLRLVRLTKMDGVSPANVPNYASIFTGNDANLNQNFVLGGFGRGRGADLTTTGGTYGYVWNSDQSLKWGENTINDAGTANVNAGQAFSSQVLAAFFDGPNSTSFPHLPHEATIAEWDSGSGWFVQNGTGNWQVRAISAYTGHDSPINNGQPGNQALFASHLDASVEAADELDGVRVAAYAAFINSHVPNEPWRIADVNSDGHVTVGDLGILATYFGQTLSGGRSVGDLNMDGSVTVGDLGILATYFGQPASAGLSFNDAVKDYPNLPANSVPEPGTVTLLGVVGIIGLMRRRR